MKTTLCCFLCVLSLLSTPPTRTELRSCAMLEAAFSMLEEGNVFLERYNEVTGSLVEARYPLGAPYFYSGYREDLLLKPVVTLVPTGYYRPKQRYLYGFDCKGFTSWVFSQVDVDPPINSLSSLLSATDDRVTVIDDFKPVAMAQKMTVGDLLVVRHGYRHVLMYIGTMRDYGFAEGQTELPNEYLDYPLLIHCGYNPFYYDRYAGYLRDWQPKCYPPDGGVTVSVMGMSGLVATNHRTDFDGDAYDYFLVDGQPLSVFDVYDCTKIVWYHHDPPR